MATESNFAFAVFAAFAAFAALSDGLSLTANHFGNKSLNSNSIKWHYTAAAAANAATNGISALAKS